MVQYRPPEESTRRARDLRRNPTDAEVRMWRLLRATFPDAQFRRQVPIRKFVVDFASHPSKLVIEADGGQHSDSVDLSRPQLIEAEGYRVIRFWNHEILGKPDGCMATITQALDDRSPPPQPSPIKGEAARKEF